MISRCSSLLLVVWVTLSLPAPVFPAPTAEAPTPAAAEASVLAQQGIDLFKQAKYADAALLFERSFQLAAAPVVAWNLARCHEELERPDEAISYFERFRDLTPEEDKKQIAVTKIERLLQRYFGALSVTVEPGGAEVLLNGRPAGFAPLKSLRVRAGTYDVELRLAGYEPQRRVVQVAPGQAFAFSFALTALPAVVIVDSPEPVGGLVILVDGARVPHVAAPARFPVSPGPHLVEVQAGPEWLALRQTVTVGAGEEATLKLTRASAIAPVAAAAGAGAEPAAAPVVVVKKDPAVRVIEAGGARKKGRSYSTVASVVLGVGLAAAGAGGVLHVVGYARWKDVTGAKTDASGHVTGVTRADAVDIADAARLKYTIAYGLYGLGAAAVATSIVLFSLNASDEASAALAPLPLPDGAGLSLSGRF